MGQELRVNNVTNPDFTSVPHGNRALATKDMRKSQGKDTTDVKEKRISFGNLSCLEYRKKFTTIRQSVWILLFVIHNEMMLMETIILY